MAISEILWGPFVKSKPSNLFKMTKKALGPNLASWFNVDHEKLAKNVQTADFSQGQKRDEK